MNISENGEANEFILSSSSFAGCEEKFWMWRVLFSVIIFHH